MALVLIKATNAVHPDPTKDQRGSYKRGDIVAVYEDSAHNGDLVTFPIAAPFVMIRIRSGQIGAIAENIGQNEAAITLEAGQAAALNPPFFAVLGPNPFNGSELVRVTSVTGDEITVTRGARGTARQAWPIGTPIERIITKNQVEKYIVPERIANADVRRRLWRVMVDDLPAGFLADLQADRWAEANWNNVRAFIQNKATLATESGASM